SRGFFKEIAGAIRYGQEVEINRVEDPQSMVPFLSDEIQAVYRMDGQSFIEPGPYVEAIAKAVKERGDEVVEGKTVETVEGAAKAAVVYADGSREEADKVFVASGAWPTDLVRDHGAKVPVQAGRGYSFSV